MIKDISPRIDESKAKIIEQEAKDLVTEYYEKYRGSGRQPSAIGCASVYISCNRNSLKVSQKEIANLGDKSVSTVRDAYKSMKEQLDYCFSFSS